MSGTGTVQGGRALLRGRILGFPVHLDISFVVIMAILGFYPGVTLTWFVLWLLITPVAVLVHELGHAVTARTTGAQPEIALAGFGGLTSWVPTGPVSRRRSLLISLAGPAVGLAIGAVLVAVYLSFGIDYFGWPATALRIGIWTCIGWSVLNLLPVLPLDGGQAMRELLPGAPEVRARRAAMVSVVTGAVAAVLAYTVFKQPFVALFMLIFVLTNALALRGPGKRVPPATAVMQLLWDGRRDEARQLMEQHQDLNLDLALHGAVQAATGEKEQGMALIRQELERRPGDPVPVTMLGFAQVLTRDWDGLFATLNGPHGSLVAPWVVEGATAVARREGRDDVAARLAPRPDRDPTT